MIFLGAILLISLIVFLINIKLAPMMDDEGHIINEKKNKSK
jgi:hypothetical protein